MSLKKGLEHKKLWVKSFVYENKWWRICCLWVFLCFDVTDMFISKLAVNSGVKLKDVSNSRATEEL